MLSSQSSSDRGSQGGAALLHGALHSLGAARCKRLLLQHVHGSTPSTHPLVQMVGSGGGGNWIARTKAAKLQRKGAQGAASFTPACLSTTPDSPLQPSLLAVHPGWARAGRLQGREAVTQKNPLKGRAAQTITCRMGMGWSEGRKGGWLGGGAASACELHDKRV